MYVKITNVKTNHRNIKTKHKGTDAELTWLLMAFSSRCTQLHEIQESNAEEDTQTSTQNSVSPRKNEMKKRTSVTGHGKLLAVPGKEKKEQKDKDKDKRFSIVSLSNLVFNKASALKYIVVFNQSFENYPSLSDRFWCLLDCGGINYCNFLEYTSLMYKVVRGSWEDRVRIAFNLFDSKKTGSITVEEVKQVVTEISEFICNVARGLLSMREFNTLKLARVHNLFEGTDGNLTFEQFSEVAEFHQSLFGCSEILDMVFGRVIRKMEMDMHRNMVFGRFLQETALGNVKDITGDLPFVPEVVASAMHFLREEKALDTPG